MKKTLFILLAVSVIEVSAQSSEPVGWVSRFGLAGGFTPTWVFPNFDELNKKVASFGLDNFKDNGLMLYGGGGYAYVMFVDNFRVGGLGLAGSKCVSGVNGGFNKEVQYSMGLGGITIEYTFPFIKKIGVSVGTILAAGSLQIEIFQNNGTESWDQIWDPVLSSASYTKLTNSYFLFTPTINIDIPFSRFFALRIGGGYNITVGGSWKYDNGIDLTNVPSSINGNSFFIQTGVFVGFFTF